MPAYKVDYSFKTEEWDDIEVDADNVDAAEIAATELIIDRRPEISLPDLYIESIKEIR